MLTMFILVIASSSVLVRHVRCGPTLSPAILEDLSSVNVRVIASSSPCSATCGLGLRVQQLCLLGDNGAYSDCQERRVRCLVIWQCGLHTLTTQVGRRVELDCLSGVPMWRFRYVFSWRYARGIVTTDDSLFSRWEVPHLHQVTLDPVRERDAGTYRCDVQDSTYRMVKRAYFGVTVLPTEGPHLDFATALARWKLPKPHESQGPNSTAAAEPVPLYPRWTLGEILAYSLSFSAIATVIVSLILYTATKERNIQLQGSIPPPTGKGGYWRRALNRLVQGRVDTGEALYTTSYSEGRTQVKGKMPTQDFMTH